MCTVSYSDMPGTGSSRLPGKIDRDIILERLEKLDEAGIPHSRDKARQEWDNLPLVQVNAYT